VQVSGEPVELSDDTAARPLFTVPPDAAGDVLIFELTVNDGYDDSVADAVEVTITTDAPIVVLDPIYYTPFGTLPGPITLDATGTSDPDNNPFPLTYAWEVTSPPGAGSFDDAGPRPDPTVEYTLPLGASEGDVFEIMLTVSDGVNNVTETTEV